MGHGLGVREWGTTSRGRRMGHAGAQRSRCTVHLGWCGRGALVQSSSSLLLGPACAEREGVQREGTREGGGGHWEEA
jgi:hypothetical protein